MSTPNATDPNYKPPPGRVGNLTESQGHTLEAFRKKVKESDYYDEKRHDDPTLLRFLRARKFDINASKLMMDNCEEWRKTFGVQGIVDEFVFTEKEQMQKYYPQYYHKTDKEGRPIYIERLGKVNLTEMYKISSQDRLLKNLVWEYERSINERAKACSDAVGHPVETFCTILDLGGIGIKQFWDVKGYVGEASKIGQDRYPETMGKFYIINAPWGFSTIFNVVKGWLDPVTQEKIKVIGSGYKKDLLENIDEKNLPSDLGGTCKCAQGCSLSDAGPWNPQTTEAKAEA